MTTHLWVLSQRLWLWRMTSWGHSWCHVLPLSSNVYYVYVKKRSSMFRKITNPLLLQYPLILQYVLSGFHCQQLQCIPISCLEKVTTCTRVIVIIVYHNRRNRRHIMDLVDWKLPITGLTCTQGLWSPFSWKHRSHVNNMQLLQWTVYK